MKLKGITEKLSDIEDRISLINRSLDGDQENHLGINQHCILVNTLSILVQQQQILKHLFGVIYKSSNCKNAMMVRALRDDLEMNQLEFANEIGVTRETVSRWETGKYSMTPKNMNLIENYIDQKITKQVTT